MRLITEYLIKKLAVYIKKPLLGDVISANVKINL